MVSLTGQLASLLWVALSGAAVAFLCDLYRVGKAAFGLRRSPLGALLDLVFGAFCGVVTFALLLVANGGELRFPTLLGLAAGAAAYWWTASPLVVWALWNLTALVVTLARMAVALAWWLARRPRPWGTP